MTDCEPGSVCDRREAKLMIRTRYNRIWIVKAIDPRREALIALTTITLSIFPAMSKHFQRFVVACLKKVLAA